MLGDESGYEAGDVQKMKLAAIEAEWHTEPAPAGFNVIAFPDQEKGENSFCRQDSLRAGFDCDALADGEVKGINDLVEENVQRIRNGMTAYGLLTEIAGRHSH